MVEHRSVSQYKQYKNCPYSYYLQRVLRNWERPAAWLPQGLAVHEAAEAYERSGRTMSTEEAQEVYKDSYATHTNRLAEETPNLDYWFASGPYHGEQDVERRWGLGLEQVSKYVEYYQQHPEEVIWITPEGEPAIELGFDIDLDGVQVRGYIDQVITHPERHEVVRDIKSGNNPGDDFQLKVYALAIEQQYGQHIETGDYWMGRKGKPTVPYKLDSWTREEVAAEFKEMDEGVKAKSFEPKPELSKCRFCSVNYACDFSA